MIFLGDVAAPRLPPHLDDGAGPSWPSSELAVANLEGPVVGDPDALATRRALFNSPDTLGWLKGQGVRVVSLANNHAMDIEAGLSPTIAACEAVGIATCGAGCSADHAAEPAVVVEGERVRVFLAFGWPVIGCEPARGSAPGVNPMYPDRVLAAVREARERWKNGAITVLVHWNYELEAYPQPAHRELAFAAIEAGANAVVGTHSHRVQGVEIHQGAPIAYGLGNWMLMEGEFFAGRLRYPEVTRRRLAFRWDPETRRMECHWYRYSPTDHRLRLVGIESLDDSDRMRELTPFAGMSHVEYVHWFRAHRVKRRGLPVYRSFRDRTNFLRDAFVRARQEGITLLRTLGLKPERPHPGQAGSK